MRGILALLVGGAGALATQFYLAPLMADLRVNSTSVDGELNNDGDWKLLVFAWGPNLVPVYDTAGYTIIR